MKALITGINGFVGGYLKKYLISCGYEVYGIDHYSHDKNTFQADITNQEMLNKIIRSIQPDEIYHLAGIANVAHSNIQDFYMVNALGTLNLYEAVKYGAIGAKILFVSSSNTYGIVPEENQPINEKQPLKPVNHYGASKASAEMISYKYLAENLKIIISRSFNHTGPGQSENFIIPKLLKAFAVKQHSIELGNTCTKRDFSDVRDVVKAYRLMMERGEPDEVYNVCSGRALAIDDIIAYAKKLTGHTIEIKHIDTFKRAVDPPLFVGDNRHLKKLGWSVEIPIEQTIRDMIDFYKQMPIK